MTAAPDDALGVALAPVRPRRRGLRPLLVRLHFYAGIFVGPFILTAAVTGLLYALVPQVDSAVFRHELTVNQVGAARLPLAAQLAAARAAHPEGSVVSIRPPAGATETTQIALAVDDVPPDYTRTVFVDPYTGEVRGALTTFGQWMPLRAWLDELHRNLHLGAVGRNYSELAASWLWIISLAGLVLWYQHRRDTGKLRRLALPDRDTTDRRRTRSWHGAVGVWVIVALLGLSVTGVTWSRYGGESVNLLQAQLNMTAPAVDTALTAGTTSDASTMPGMDMSDSAGSGPGSGGAHDQYGAAGSRRTGDGLLFGADRALGAAGQAGLRGPIWMYPPAAPDEGWQIAENKRDWPTRYDAIAVDPDTGAVTDRVNFADWPVLAKLTDWAIGAHMGILFGIPNQILLALTAIGLISIVIRGYVMWWKRRPTGGPRWVAGRPPARGALSELPKAAAAGVLAVAVVVGWFLPLFGVSLALFLAVDLGRAALVRRRAAARD